MEVVLVVIGLLVLVWIIANHRINSLTLEHEDKVDAKLLSHAHMLEKLTVRVGDQELKLNSITREYEAELNSVKDRVANQATLLQKHSQFVTALVNDVKRLDTELSKTAAVPAPLKKKAAAKKKGR